MKRLLAAVLVVALTAGVARANDSDAAATGARRMRKAGAGLMAVGLIHLGAGLALTFAMVGLQRSCDGRPFPCGEGLELLMVPAFTLDALGGMLTGVGMPLFLVGRHRERRYADQLALTPVPMGQLTPVPPMPQ